MTSEIRPTWQFLRNFPSSFFKIQYICKVDVPLKRFDRIFEVLITKSLSYMYTRIKNYFLLNSWADKEGHRPELYLRTGVTLSYGTRTSLFISVSDFIFWIINFLWWTRNTGVVTNLRHIATFERYNNYKMSSRGFFLALLKNNENGIIVWSILN